jgi:hypothetical protein
MSKRNLLAQTLKEVVRQKEQTEDDIKSHIKIIEELKALIPALTSEEFSQLEENILLEGCRESLILWKNNEDYVLIDGHNRYQICQKHKIDFKIVIKEFAGIEEVTGWMINNQLGRRNLTPAQQSYLRGKRYDNEKAKVTNPYGIKGVKGQNDLQLSKLRDEGQNDLQLSKLKDKGKNDPQLSKLRDEGQNDPQLNTAQKLAKELNISEKTIKRDAEYARGLDKIGESNQTLKQAILSGKSNVDKGKIRSLGKISEKVVIDTEQDIDNIITNKQPRKQPSKPTIAQMRKVLENAGSNVIIEIKGKFLIENNLAVYWQELRQLENPITADFTDYITWGQAKTIGLVK